MIDFFIDYSLYHILFFWLCMLEMTVFFCLMLPILILFLWLAFISVLIPSWQKDEPGRGRTCNLQIRSLTRFHCATGPYYCYAFILLFLLFFFILDYLFPFFISVGSYQVGYTRSHPNTEVKMLRACSVPLCSHRWERQVIYLFVFF